MSGQNDNSPSTFWIAEAKSLARRINTAWFLQTLTTPLLVTSTIGAAFIILARRELPTIDPLVLTLIAVAAIAATILISLVLAAKRFETPERAIVRIEGALGLNNALTAAKAGVSPWPNAPEKLPAHLRWHLPKTLIPPLAAISLLALGLLIPISAKSPANLAPSMQPQAWSQLDSQLEQLAQDALLDETYLEEIRDRLDQLRAQEEQDWFSHASLEATDTLKESHQAEIQRLSEDLNEAKKALDSLTKGGDQLSPDQQKKLADDFEQALQGLQNGAMKPNPQLLDQLSKLDPENLGQLNPEQLEQLKEGMEKLSKCLSDCDGQGNGESDWTDELLEDGSGDGQGEGESENPGDGPGSGGIDRGGEHAPGVLKNPKDRLDIGDPSALESNDLSRALPGDLLQIQDGTHNPNLDPSRPTTGGDASRGSGGDRVWRDSLAPDEQRTLKKFFE